MARYKIDSEGNYLSYPGYTVIFKTNSASLDTRRAIEHRLSHHQINEAFLARYYSILPIESWHVTAINLFTKDAVEDEQRDWDRYVASQETFFSQLSSAIEQGVFTPVITYSGLRVDGAIQAIVTLDENSKKRVEALAEHYGYQRNVPRHFHMTLGYQYKPLNNKDLDALKSDLAPFIQDFFKNMRVALEPAQLCYFDDMTAFIPWRNHQDRILHPKHSIFAPCVGSDERESKGKSGRSYDLNGPK